MSRPLLPPKSPRRRRRGFTLIEILIVGALISLLSGIAIFAVKQMYDSNRRKAMFDETRSIGTALHFAYEDLGFFPRLSVVGKTKSLLTFTSEPLQIQRIRVPEIRKPEITVKNGLFPEPCIMPVPGNQFYNMI